MTIAALLQIELAHPVRYRAKARKARELANIAPSEDAPKVLLNDARLWDRLAEYEEAETNPIRPLPALPNVQPWAAGLHDRGGFCPPLTFALP